MKKRILSYAVAAFATLSCSSMASLQTQVYDDGVYTRPVAQAAPEAVSGEEVDNLLAMSKQSPAYILSEGDTLVVPAGSEVRFRNNSTVLDIVDTTLPVWAWDYPWYYGTRWAWDPWYHDYWFYSPWRYRSWYYDSWYYRPWHYRYYGYYSPWYYSSWAWDPWYYDSWYYRHHLYGYFGYGYHGYSRYYGRPGFYHVNRHLYGPENNGRQSVSR